VSDVRWDVRHLSVGQVAQRSGVAVSTLHFYERKGLLAAERTSGNQRRYRRHLLRRIAMIRIGQRVGSPLAEIKEALDELPADRVPNQRDWEQLASRWRADLDLRIQALHELRDDFTGCIGCGCLSLERCTTFNPRDVLGDQGPGPRTLPVRGDD